MSLRLWLLTAAWSGLMIAGLFGLLVYDFTAEPVLSAPVEWPAQSDLPRDPSRPTLLMFLHPRCPCSRASLAELSRLAADCGNAIRIEVVVVTPANAEWDDEVQPSLIREVAGAELQHDRGGIEAERFHSVASGECFLFDRDGQQLFHGGLTGSRGHEGANVGRSAVAALVHGDAPLQTRCPVFGCRLPTHSAPPSL